MKNDTITTRDGLLWRGGEVVSLPEADEVARQAGFFYAEQYVRHLEEQSKEGDKELTDFPITLIGDKDHKLKSQECVRRLTRQRTVNNWLPVVASLLSLLQKAGFQLDKVDDGGEPDEIHILEGTPRERRQQAKAAICAVVESHLYFTNPEGEKRWILIVLGNGPEEIASDYSGFSEIDEVVEAHNAQWTGRTAPQKPA